MYKPRHLDDTTAAVDDFDSAESAFNKAPRRSRNSLTKAMAGHAVPVASLGLAGALLGAMLVTAPRGEAMDAVPAPQRTVDTLSRNTERTDAEVSTAVTKAVGEWKSEVPAAAGTRFTLGNLSLREAADSDSKKLATLERGTQVTITDVVSGEYRLVSSAEGTGYVLNGRLSATKPVDPKPEPVEKAEPKTEAKDEPAEATSTKKATTKKVTATKATFATKATSTKKSSTLSTTAVKKQPLKALSGGKSVLGLQPEAMVVYRDVMARWGGQLNSVGGWRAHSRSVHQYGRAIDFMLTPGKESALGWAIARHVAANASAYGVDHIIFEQKIWTPYKPVWRSMADRGSITQNHYDHVHVAVKDR